MAARQYHNRWIHINQGTNEPNSDKLQKAIDMKERYIVIYGSGIWNNQRPCVQDTNTGEDICACQEEAMAHRIARLLNEVELDTNDHEFDF